MFQSTISRQDLGWPSRSPLAPNRPSATESASGDWITQADIRKPAIFWVALVGLLVLLRLLIEYRAGR